MISIYNRVHFLWPRAYVIITFFITNTILENIKQWRFEFLLDTVLCFRFCPKDHRDKDRGRKGRKKGEHFLQPPANAD